MQNCHVIMRACGHLSYPPRPSPFLIALPHPINKCVHVRERAYLPSSVTTISGNLVQYFLIFKKKSSSYIILVIHDIEAHKMLHHATYVCKYVLINNMYVHNNIIIARKASLLLVQMEPAVFPASPPSRTTGPRCLYVFMYLSGIRVRVPDTVNF